MTQFQRTLKSRATIKNKKLYEFSEFSQEELEDGKKHTFEKPLYLQKQGVVYELYSEDGKLTIVMLHSWDKFVEVEDGKKKEK